MGQQINRISGKIVIVLSVTAFRVGRRHGGTYLSALNRGTGADDLAFPRDGGLEAAFAKRAPIGIPSRRVGSRVWSAVLPRALPIGCDATVDQANLLPQFLVLP
jgi:hypothetical protein